MVDPAKVQLPNPLSFLKWNLSQQYPGADWNDDGVEVLHIELTKASPSTGRLMADLSGIQPLAWTGTQDSAYALRLFGRMYGESPTFHVQFGQRVGLTYGDILHALYAFAMWSSIVSTTSKGSELTKQLRKAGLIPSDPDHDYDDIAECPNYQLPWGWWIDGDKANADVAAVRKAVGMRFGFIPHQSQNFGVPRPGEWWMSTDGPMLQKAGQPQHPCWLLEALPKSFKDVDASGLGPDQAIAKIAAASKARAEA